MSVWQYVDAQRDSVRIPISQIACLRMIFPAAKIVHCSRGIDRTAHLPTRIYETPSGQWATHDTNLIRLLHNDFPFVIERVAKLPMDSEFLAISTNYGSNPYYCIRYPLSEKSGLGLFYLEQEVLQEAHFGFSVWSQKSSLHIDTLQMSFEPGDQFAKDISGRTLPKDALIFTAPAIVWNGEFVGWENYARATYDCRHTVNLQYVNKQERREEFERIRAKIQSIQRLWEDRDRFVDEVLRLANSVGYSAYERLILGVGGQGDSRFVLLSSMSGTAEDVAAQLRARYPEIEAALQIAEGGATGTIVGTPCEWKIVGPSSYRRGRVLCCLLVETK